MDEPQEEDYGAYADAVYDYEVAERIDTDHLAWGCLVGFCGVGAWGALMSAIEGFVVNGDRSYVTDAAAALRHFGYHDVGELVDQALDTYEAANGDLAEEQWDEYRDRWNALVHEDIVERIRERVPSVLSGDSPRQR